MIAEIVKLTVSEFVFRILQNDALKFGFLKRNDSPNMNALLNKVIPNLVCYRKLRRREIHDILESKFVRRDAEEVYECVNTVIDQVYFSDAELNELEETIWFRPSQKDRHLYDEIEDSESKIARQPTSAYIRGLLNEYSRLPQYKRESILFDKELQSFVEASETGKIVHAVIDGRAVRIFAFHNVYEYTFDQGNYLIGYNLTDHVIEAIPLYKFLYCYVVERKYKPSIALISALQDYYENGQYDTIMKWEESSC